MRVFAVVAVLAVLGSRSPTGPVTAFEATLRGRTCSEGRPEPQQRNCEFKVGKTLHFEIAGVGQRDAAVTFYKVDWDTDFYASVGMGHGCVIVKATGEQGSRALDMAFVSPRNGKVYRTWQACDAEE